MSRRSRSAACTSTGLQGLSALHVEGSDGPRQTSGDQRRMAALQRAGCQQAGCQWDKGHVARMRGLLGVLLGL